MAETALHEFVGAMRVQQLAELAGITVEQLVALVGTDGAQPPLNGRAKATHALSTKVTESRNLHRNGGRTRPRAPSSPTREDAATPTLREVHEALDRWLLGTVLEQTDGNITHAAESLGVTRKRVRTRWAEVHALEVQELSRRLAQFGGSAPPPTPERLHALGTYNAVHEAIDHWVLGQVLDQEAGNITLTARRLDISRRRLRERWSYVHQ